MTIKNGGAGVKPTLAVTTQFQIAIKTVEHEISLICTVLNGEFSVTKFVMEF